MTPRRVHLIGIGGAGMSSLAAVLAFRGATVSGSDREHDRGGNPELFRWLRDHGVRLFPQDGSGLADRYPEVVASGAVEADVPELRAARAAGLPIRHRSEVLAAILHGGRGIAIAGTSGKSTVTAMVAWILRSAGREPTFLGGAPLVAPPPGEDRPGAAPGPAAWAGSPGLVVAEADESDGSLVRYRPEVGVVTNLTADHRPLPELRTMFRTFAASVRGALVVPFEDAEAGGLEAGVPRARFGVSPGADPRAEAIETGRWVTTFRVGGTDFRLPLPGRFNVRNALAALAASRHLGVPDAAAAEALSRFPGLSRRMERVGERRGVEVIDDFAHNPDKVAAALDALRGVPGRLHVAFQLHGFGPARMHRAGLVEAFAAHLGPEDRLYLLPVYFAGGTVERRVTEADYVADLQARGVDAVAEPRDPGLAARLAGSAREGDRVVVMGARDPSLPALARDVLAALG
ncbi:MAG: Mur ligase domain-containing protein [Acidobacteriota bacterium]